MTEPISDRDAMVAGMKPRLHDAAYNFVVSNRADNVIAKFAHTFAVIREDEGTTFIVEREQAIEAGHEGPDFARITLNVHSALEGVGLTAAVSTGLAEAKIACNVVAGFYHDHLFVPWERREEALALLEHISQDARR